MRSRNELRITLSALDRAFPQLIQTISSIATESMAHNGFWPSEPTKEEVEEELRKLCDATNEGRGPQALLEIASDWAEPKFSEKCALFHSEISEALEGDRKGNGPDDKVPEFSCQEAELADVVIRIFDWCGKHDLRLGEAIIAKMLLNLDREPKHGKNY